MGPADVGQEQGTFLGWSRNPIARRVVDRNSCYYIESYKYFCDSCKTSIYATQPTFLAQLDEFIQESFPAVYTHRGSIDKSLLQQMVSLFDKSLGPEAFANMTKEAHREEHCSRELRYLSRMAYLKKQPRLFSDSREPQTFSSFEDQSKYARFVPSGAYSSDLLVK